VPDASGKPAQTGIAIRQAMPPDLAELIRLEQFFPSDRLSRRSLREYILTASARVMVAKGEGRLLGAIIVRHRRRCRSAIVESLVVDPAARGLGIARDLMRCGESIVRNWQCDSLTLTVRRDNAPALNLYESLGFEVYNTIDGYYSDGTAGLRMTKALCL